ncbi:MAG: hypothetical protein ACK5KM_06950 [Hyphomicrobiaceae bacterium]
MAQLKRPVRPFHGSKTSEPLGTATAVPGDVSQGDCDCTDADLDLPRIVDFGFDPIDVLIIDLIRCVCAGYASGDMVHWDTACDVAEQELGAIDGPSFVARTISLMRAVQRERKNGFGYMTRGCAHICEHELILIALIRAARQQHTINFKTALSSFASVPNPARIAVAASALAGLCVRHQALCCTETLPMSKTLN